jgi:hypothetical protein
MTRSEQEIVEQVILSLGTYNLGDIRAIRETKKNIATFILCSCFIDQVSRYRYYDVSTDRERFKLFADNYLPNFKGKGEQLYYSLRSALVHNYSTKSMYVLEWENRSLHLTYTEDGRQYIDIDEFIEELEAAFNKYTNELIADPKLQKGAIDHQKVYPILRQRS